jgi:hypothetical protein
MKQWKACPALTPGTPFLFWGRPLVDEAGRQFDCFSIPTPRDVSTLDPLQHVWRDRP